MLRPGLVLLALVLTACGPWITDEVAGNAGQPDCAWYPDNDKDGFGDLSADPLHQCSDPGDRYVDGSGETDCNDKEPEEWPGRTWFLDNDGDGYGLAPTVSCARPEDHSDVGGDCDDDAAGRFPGNEEICDGLDNDCNEQVDDGLSTSVWYDDDDGDGFGDPNASATLCDDPGDGSVLDDTDCDDSEATMFPGNTEICDGLDNDCDGDTPTDETDDDGDAYVECDLATPPWAGVISGRDCDDGRSYVYPTAPEVCDGLDNDCDGSLSFDESDDDGDGRVECAYNQQTWEGDPAVNGGGDCNDNDPSILGGVPEICDGLDNDCDGVIPPGEIDHDADSYVECTLDVPPWLGVVGGGDCDDTSDAAASVNPGAAEICDGLDNDCSGAPLPDEVDDDLDQFVVCELLGSWEGGGVVAGGSDCDDADPTVYPAAPELCDVLDNNCDLVIPTDETDDDGDGENECSGLDCNDDDNTLHSASEWYPDIDVDGFGSDTASPVVQCTQPPSHVLDENTDCDDLEPLSYPGNTEVCDGLDNDCSGLPDDGLLFADWFDDVDTDGFGDPATLASLCEDPQDGRIADGSDCDDSQPTRFPGNPEVCDGLDNDCSGAAHPTEVDVDGDQFVLCDLQVQWLGGGFVVGGNDCNDADLTIYPSAPELCDGLTNNCLTPALPAGESDVDGDGEVACVIDPDGWQGDPLVLTGGDCDDNDPALHSASQWYLDFDADGFGSDIALPVVQCDQPASHVLYDNTDCDDLQPASFPLNPEVCDGLDNDCLNGPDDGLLFVDYYPDLDSDGFGDESAIAESMCADDPLDDLITDNTDCDDALPSVFPLAPELCDGEDNDCDGSPRGDEIDSDLDFYVGCDLATPAWAGIIGGLDCNENDITVYPAAPELCDGLDNDCNLILPGDENDVDADGYFACEGDCDDSEPTMNHMEVEICDGLDNDCDGILNVVELDLDLDTYVPCTLDVPPWGGVTGGDDCDDAAPTRYPTAVELCDGLDNDCDGSPLGSEDDSDGDFYVGCALDTAPWGGIIGGLDCDEIRPDVYPSAPELCDGLDNDCNGVTPGNELDGDADGAAACQGDCDDSEPTVYPGNSEICDGLDNNCDGLSLLEVDNDVDGYVECTLDVAPWAAVLGGDDCDDTLDTVFPGAPEICDSHDNDCDGSPMPEEEDADGDFHVECMPVAPWPLVIGGGDCDETDDTVYLTAPELCDGLDNDCTGGVPADEQDADTDGFFECEGDCDDSQPTVYPGNIEICDGLDNDCIGGSDDGLLFQFWYVDGDSDNFGSDAAGTQLCEDPLDGRITVGGDCDDTRPTVYPGASELCDGLANPCGGNLPANEDDNDSDDVVACTIDVGGWQGPVNKTGDDCRDNDDTVYPGAPELCDGQDNDCDGSIPAVETDDDAGGGDGYVECALDAGGWDGAAILGGDDCDDVDRTIYPLAPELCDGIINNCLLPSLLPNEEDDDGDGYVECTLDGGGWDGPVAKLGDDCDDGDLTEYPGLLWHTDNDGDGQGQPGVSSSCDRAVISDVLVNTDCDDTNPTIYLGASELCDGLINACGGSLPLDEQDPDLDGWVECAFNPGEWGGAAVSGGGDCIANNNTAYPGAVELCDGLDNDCDGSLPGVETDDDVGGGDGYVECSILVPWGFLGDDCDDTDPNIWPGAAEVWYDGTDQDCDPVTEYDQDGDGYSDPSDPSGGTDCVDTDPTINPGAVDSWYDGTDQDCDGADDYDTDGDGQIPDAFVGLSPLPIGDCDDNEPTIFTGAQERCDGQLNDCVGAMLAAEFDGDGDGHVICTIDAGGWDGDPLVVGGNDCNDAEITIYSGAPELCDGLANNCNAAFPAQETDTDGDGFVACTIDAGGWDGLGSPGGDDCDNAEATVYPGAPELCDGQLNDCDASFPTNEADNDGDGDVECTFDAGGWDGLPAVTGGDDCDDADPTSFVGGFEVCDLADNDCNGFPDDGCLCELVVNNLSQPDSTTCQFQMPQPGGVQVMLDNPDASVDGYFQVEEAVLGKLPRMHTCTGDEVFYPTNCDPGTGVASSDLLIDVTVGTVLNLTLSYDPAGGIDYAGTDTLTVDFVAGTQVAGGQGSLVTSLDTDSGDVVTFTQVPLTIVGPGEGIVVDAVSCSPGGGGHVVYLDGQAILEVPTGEAPCWAPTFVPIDPGSYTLKLTHENDAPAGSDPRRVDIYGYSDCSPGCNLESVLPLASADVKLHRTVGNDLGTALLAVPDWNGDGKEELLVAARNQVFLVHGGVSAPMLMDDAYSAMVAGNINRPKLADVGDVDGDGLPEYAIASTSAATNGLAGYVMNADDTGILDTTLDAVATFTGGGHGTGGPSSAVTGGDFDRDGEADIVFAHYYGTGDNGKVQIYPGPVSGAYVFGDAVWSEYRGNGSSGLNILATGDVNGDGDDNLLISAFNGPGGVGAVWLVLDPIGGVADLTTDADATWAGYGSRSNPSALVSGSDLDGDGRDDMLVGASDFDLVALGDYNGAVHLVLGSAIPGGGLLSAASTIFYGDVGDQLMSAAFVPDMDRDGIAEVMVGPNGGGTGLGNRALIYLSPGIGTYAPIDADHTILGEFDMDRAGRGVAAGDLDGDGSPEWIVGAPNNAGRGAVYWYGLSL